ncbi:MAG TPA: DNA polymerase [Pyrinomonadaceae bacterium]
MAANKSTTPEGPTERVYLIDSMSHIFRAYFAPMAGRTDPLMNSQGQVTQAVFVFTNMLRKLLSDEKPHYIAAVFESGEKTFRHETFTDYKAHRAEMPEDLVSQLPYIIRVCEAYNIPILNAPGFEADDVIGTLAVQAAERGLQAVIVSNDKDMCQLVRDPWTICMRQNSQNVKRKEPVPPVEWCDEAWVENKFGVPPSQIIDLLGLMGDSVDNIPGAPGIGAKGAVQIVKQFGSIENALKGWEEVKHKTYRESLRDNADLIRQSRELATIRTDVNIDLDLEKLRSRPPDRAAAYQLFRELEFQSLTREFSDAASSVETVSAPRRYRIIRKRAELDSLVRGLWEAEHWGFSIAECGMRNTDSENRSSFNPQSAGPNPQSPAGLAIATAPGASAYVDLENFEDGMEAAVAPLRDVIMNGLLSKSVHDLKRAVALLSPLGIEPEGVTDDTLLAAYLLDPIRSKYELGDLAREALGTEGAGDPPEGWTENQWRAAEAADLTAQTAHVLHGRLLENGLEAIYNEMELPLAPLLYRMERAGLKVDTEVLSELSKYLGSELEKLTKKIYEVAGREFKINSPKQVGDVLEELNISSGRKTSTGRVSTSKAVLEELAQSYELPRLIIEYRELDKLKTVYTDALPEQITEDGRIHGQLNQTVTATGRLSCLPAGTFVSTSRGLIGIEQVRVGDTVRTPYGARRVLAWQATGSKPVVVLRLSNGIELRCSPEHRLRSQGQWLKAEEIEVGAPVYMSFTEGLFGDEIALDLQRITAYVTRKSPLLPVRWTEELAELVGYCMADGHIVHSNYNGKPSKVVLAFGWTDDELIERFTKSIEQLFYKEPTRRITKSCLTLDVSGIDIASAFEQLGAGGKSGTIRVPPSIFTAPKHIVAAFLRGYFEGDGCVTAQTHGPQVRSVSRGMLADVQQLLTLFGVASTVRGGTPDPRGYAPRYTLALVGDKSKHIFADNIGFISQRKQVACYAAALKDHTRSNAEVLTLPVSFQMTDLKPLIYAPYRAAGKRVPNTITTFAYKMANGRQAITLDRARWITSRLPAHLLTEGTRFLREATDGQLYEVRIASVRREPTAVPMYDIAVDEVEQYMAQGIVVHNSSSPNLQNIPIRTELGRRIRRAFVAEKGHKLISADYSQLELRLLAHVTHDPVMLDAFQKGDDIHERTARLVFNAKTKEELKEARRFAKIVNFAIAYAIEPFGLSQRVGISRKEAKKVIDDYYETYKGVHRFMEEVPEKARELGHVRSIYGRIRPIPGINDRNGNIRNRAEREAINHPIQGSASDIVKLAMLHVDEAIKREGLKARMLMQVHDELLVEAPKAEAERVAELLRREMESAVELDVPLKVEVGIGDNWMDAK